MLYVVAGNGTGPAKEITAALKDLKDKAYKDDAEFWVLVEGKDEPTSTDQTILKWMAANEVWFEVYTTTGTTYDGAQDTISVEDVFNGYAERLQERRDDNEDVAVLILPVNPDGDAPEDEELMAFVEACVDAEVDVFALNGEMAKITLGDGTEEAEAEAEEPEPAPVKSATKKAAAPAKKAAKRAAPAKAVAKRATPVEEEPEDEVAAAEPVVYTSDELAKMTVAELGAVARSQGIDPKGMGKRDLVVAISAKLEGEAEGFVEGVRVAQVVDAANLLNGDEPVLVLVVPLSRIQMLLGN